MRGNLPTKKGLIDLRDLLYAVLAGGASEGSEDAIISQLDPFS
jgi:hypothetical protein